MLAAKTTPTNVSKIPVQQQPIKIRNTFVKMTILFLLPALVQPETYCSVPSVKIGQDSILTCYFDDDVSMLKENFKVEHHVQNQSSETVTDCNWEKVNPTPHCYSRPGYALKGRISNTVEVHIYSANYQHVGNYSCTLAPSVKQSYKFCSFTLQDVEGSSSSLLYGVCITFVVILPILIKALIVLLCRKKLDKLNKDGDMKELRKLEETP